LRNPQFELFNFGNILPILYNIKLLLPIAVNITIQVGTTGSSLARDIQTTLF